MEGFSSKFVLPKTTFRMDYALWAVKTLRAATMTIRC